MALFGLGSTFRVVWIETESLDSNVNMRGTFFPVRKILHHHSGDIIYRLLKLIRIDSENRNFGPNSADTNANMRGTSVCTVKKCYFRPESGPFRRVLVPNSVQSIVHHYCKIRLLTLD